ncbi:MAG: 2-hydroxyhepta-2,4-diene-1,7-dioate isomerase, partial [Staphylococcus hominis]
ESFTLLPGDVIATGSPAGTAEMVPGDYIEVEIPGIGKLGNPVERA